MTFETIHKTSTPRLAAEQILRRIREGGLEPGQKLPSQRELSEQLGVGRSSLREAVNALVVMGHLEVRHGSGTYVRAPQPPAEAPMRQLAAAFEAVGLLDLMEARETLECRSAALAAERADAGQVARLKECLTRLQAAGGEYRIFLKEDVEFHIALAQATGNVIFEELTRLLLEKLIRWHGGLHTARLSPGYRLRSVRSAARVVEAVAGGNARRATRWMQIHLEAIRQELKDIF